MPRSRRDLVLPNHDELVVRDTDMGVFSVVPVHRRFSFSGYREWSQVLASADRGFPSRPDPSLDAALLEAGQTSPYGSLALVRLPGDLRTATLSDGTPAARPRVFTTYLSQADITAYAVVQAHRRGLVRQHPVAVVPTGIVISDTVTGSRQRAAAVDHVLAAVLGVLGSGCRQLLLRSRGDSTHLRELGFVETRDGMAVTVPTLTEALLTGLLAEEQA